MLGISISWCLFTICPKNLIFNKYENFFPGTINSQLKLKNHWKTIFHELSRRLNRTILFSVLDYLVGWFSDCNSIIFSRMWNFWLLIKDNRYSLLWPSVFSVLWIKIENNGPEINQVMIRRNFWLRGCRYNHFQVRKHGKNR